MSSLIEGITHIIAGYTDTSSGTSVEVPGLVDWLSDVASALIANPVFQIMLAVVLFVLFFGLMVGLAKGVKGRKRKKR